MLANQDVIVGAPYNNILQLKLSIGGHCLRGKANAKQPLFGL
jgi:hypothetical protein